MEGGDIYVMLERDGWGGGLMDEIPMEGREGEQSLSFGLVPNSGVVPVS
jgi:hypothetical protein